MLLTPPCSGMRLESSRTSMAGRCATRQQRGLHRRLPTWLGFLVLGLASANCAIPPCRPLRLAARPVLPAASQPQGRRRQRPGRTAAPQAAAAAGSTQAAAQAPTDIEYDAVIIGSGMGGLTTAAQMASKGAKVVVLEK